MRSLKVVLSEDLESRLRILAMRKFGYGKGSISKAVEEALEMWLKQHGSISSDLEKKRAENNEFYEEIKPKLVSEYYGKFVALADGRILASGDTLTEVCKTIKEKDLNLEHVIFTKVGDAKVARRRLGWRASMRRKRAGDSDKT